MLPLRLFRSRSFAAANGAALLMSFGLFGSIFLLSQFFQSVQGLSPLDAGLRLLPWTVAPMFVAPVAGALSDRIGGRPLMVTVCCCRRPVSSGRRESCARRPVLLPDRPLRDDGDRHGAVLRARGERRALGGRPDQTGQGLGRERRHPGDRGVLGVAVLAAVFSHAGGDISGGEAYMDACGRRSTPAPRPSPSARWPRCSSRAAARWRGARRLRSPRRWTPAR
jgi:hypothetical protein